MATLSPVEPSVHAGPLHPVRIGSAVVRGCVAGARLHHRRQVVEVEGPPTGLASLIGTAHGQEGENAVAVQFELCVEADTSHG